MALNQLLAMLSNLELEDEIHIYPLTSLHHLRSVFPTTLPEIKKHHIHALLHQLGALKIQNGDVKPVKKMQGLKELLVSSNIHLCDYKPRDSERYFTLDARRISGIEGLEPKINSLKCTYLQIKISGTPKRASHEVPRTEKKEPAAKTKSIESIGTRKTLIGEVINRAQEPLFTDRTEHWSRVYRDVKWPIADREYYLPIHYNPISDKDLKIYHEFKGLSENKDEEIKEMKLEIQRLEKADKEKCDRIIAIQIEKEHELAAKNKNHANQIRDKDGRISELEEQLEDSFIARAIGKKLLKLQTLQKQPNTIQAQRLYGIGFGLIPQISVNGYAKVIPLVCAAFLADLDILQYLDNVGDIANICPSPTTIKNNLDRARDIAYQQIGRIIAKGTPIAIIQDKGNKNGNDRLLVQMAYYCFAMKGVDLRTVLGDICPCGTDKAVAQTIDQLFLRIELNIEELLQTIHRIKYHAQGTDSGGGGVSESVMDALDDLDRVAPGAYLSTCAQHGHSRPFQVCFENIFGKGGLTLNSLLQFLHTCWSIQDALGENFLVAWNEFVGDNEEHGEMLRLIKPLLTRWAYVNKCAAAILDRWDDWGGFLDGIFKCVTTKEENMARKCLAMRKDPKLKCELQFVVAFGKVFFTKHFIWMQRIDKHTKRAGFFSHEMLPHLAAMEVELKSLQRNWDTMDEFASCKATLDLLPPDVRNDDSILIRSGKETTLEQFTDFFKEYIDIFDKQFFRWKKKLAPLAIASSDDRVAAALAKWYLAEGNIQDSDDETDIFENSSVHTQCKLTMKQWVACLKTCEFNHDIILVKHLHAVHEIANGASIYAQDASEQMVSLLRDVKIFYFIIPAVTQMVEAAVQESSICSQSGKGEDDVSTLITIRSFDILPVLSILREFSKTRIKRANQHVSAGRSGERVFRSRNAIRNAQRRLESGAKEREQLHATKHKAREHLRHAIDTCPTVTDVQALRKAGKKRKAGTANPNLQIKAKDRRRRDTLEQYRSRIATTRKSSENIAAMYIDTPDQYDGLFPITKFSKILLRDHCHRELIARGLSPLDCTTHFSMADKAKQKLARVVRASRPYPPDDLETMVWKDLKTSLDSSEGKLFIRLLDGTNKTEIKKMFEISKKGYRHAPVRADL